MKWAAILVLSIFLVSGVYAICSSGQININTASASELDNLYGIGPAKAQSIISTRPFSSVDDLIKVSGIGAVTLQKIKDQGLACVDNVSEQNTENKTTQVSDTNVTPTYQNPEPQNYTPQVINLNPQVIKTENNTKTSGSNPAIYELFGFGLLIIALLFIKKVGHKKSEFE